MSSVSQNKKVLLYVGLGSQKGTGKQEVINLARPCANILRILYDSVYQDWYLLL